MAALLARMEDHVPGLRSAPRFLVRHLLGDGDADLLGVRAGEALPAPITSIWRLARRPREALLARASALLARPVLEAIVSSNLRSG
jgi:hypothetical protein